MTNEEIQSVVDVATGKKSIKVDAAIDMQAAALLALFIFLAVFLAVVAGNAVSKKSE